MLRIGVDTGGTFTDFVVLEDSEVRVFKVPSTPDHPEEAVLEGSLKTLTSPSSKTTKSVNVPPVSTPILSKMIYPLMVRPNIPRKNAKIHDQISHRQLASAAAVDWV